MKKTEPKEAPSQLGAHEPSGAGAALAWIASKEADGRKVIDELEKELRNSIAIQRETMEGNGEEIDRIVRRCQNNLDDAMERHHKLLKQLRDFDKAVAPEKRSAEETITREEGAKLFSMFVIYMRTAIERIKENIVPRIRESATNEEGFVIVDATLSEEFRSAIKSAAENQNLPSWGIDAVEGAI